MLSLSPSMLTSDMYAQPVSKKCSPPQVAFHIIISTRNAGAADRRTNFRQVQHPSAGRNPRLLLQLGGVEAHRTQPRLQGRHLCVQSRVCEERRHSLRGYQGPHLAAEGGHAAGDAFQVRNNSLSPPDEIGRNLAKLSRFERYPLKIALYSAQEHLAEGHAAEKD